MTALPETCGADDGPAIASDPSDDKLRSLKIVRRSVALTKCRPLRVKGGPYVRDGLLSVEGTRGAATDMVLGASESENERPGADRSQEGRPAYASTSANRPR